jgi:hypothetical protein
MQVRIRNSAPARLRLLVLAALLLLPPATVPAQFVRGTQPPLTLDCDFPGGNIVVDAIEEDTVSVHQDLRDTQGDWFYWYFRVRGAAARTLTFRFTKGNVLGVRGPAVSTDHARTWKWLGKSAVTGRSFRYTFPRDAKEVRFCFTMPYLESDLREFLSHHAGNPHLRTDVLCKTRKGRDVELLRLGRLDGDCQHRVLITCRHHACETMASYALEGIMEAILAETDEARWFRENVEFLILPFTDKDGVEEGDQGKNRKPHDHNRDYADGSVYPSVRALKQLVPKWSGGRLRVALDLHCPWIRGQHNEDIYFVGAPAPENWEQIKRLSEILEDVRIGPLPFDSKNDLPFGKAWNTDTGPLWTFSRWACELPGIAAAGGLELPYANASGIAVTAETARAFGHDLALALHRFLSEIGQSREGPPSHP